MSHAPRSRFSIGTWGGALAGFTAALGLSLIMTSSAHALAWWELLAVLALPALAGGAGAGALTALLARRVATTYSKWRIVAISITVPMLTAAAAGSLFGLWGGWVSAQEHGRSPLGPALEAAAGGAGLGFAFGLLALPVTGPLMLLLLRVLR